mgnify:CR=1 FL=1
MRLFLFLRTLNSWFSLFLLLLFLQFGVGCASVTGLFKERGAEKEFFMRKVWVKPTPNIPNNGFRKIQRTEPVLHDGLVIYGNSYFGLLAYDEKRGGLVWKREIPEGVESSGAVFKDSLYVGGLDGVMRSIAIKTGAINWEFSARAEIVSQPTFDSTDGRVFFLAGNNILYALNAESGTLLWQYNRPETSAFSVRGGGRPAVVGQQIYMGFSDGSLVCLDTRNGSVLWENQISKAKKFQDLDSAPIVDKDLIVTAGFEGDLIALNRSNGAQAWKIPLAGLYADPLADEERYYLASPQGILTAIRKSDGQKLWDYKGFIGVPSKPALLRGVLLVGDSGGPIQAVEAATGRKVGELDTGRGVFSPLAIDPATSMAYFSSREGHAYSAEFGYRFPYWIAHLVNP